jgi:hypothetical protein
VAVGLDDGRPIFVVVAVCSEVINPPTLGQDFRHPRHELALGYAELLANSPSVLSERLHRFLDGVRQREQLRPEG